MIIRDIVCIGICAVIWIVNSRWIIQSAKERFISEIYMHIGLSIFFTLLTLELTIGKEWMHLDILWLKIIGWVLYVPSAYLGIVSHIALTHRGKPETSALNTTILVDTGIYSIIGQPMTLGMTIWSIALILVFQSVFSIILGACSMFCFWMSARKEAEDNIKKFGERKNT
ncbi:MAG: hypothetical protein HY769_00975 [Candidatus Stahlbacteria bacterium]|nr:hypothetical protein [Candidatus Stahlbacteria bacterium]